MRFYQFWERKNRMHGSCIEVIEENKMKIIKNAIRCNICGDEIESKYRQNYVRCSCGACAVDGGHDYLRRTFKNKESYTDISVVEDDSDEE